MTICSPTIFEAMTGDQPICCLVQLAAHRRGHPLSEGLPSGGGWRIQSLAQTTVDGVEVGGQPLRVNRALIQSDDQRQLVYYWFLQRGRVVTNEYLVKWYLFVDSVTRHRSDGALVPACDSDFAGREPAASRSGVAKFRRNHRFQAAAVHSRISALPMQTLFGFFLAMSITMLLMPLLIRSAGPLRIMDIPEARKVHAAPVPRVGGIAMVAGIVTALLVWDAGSRQIQALLLCIGVLLVFGVWGRSQEPVFRP